MKNIFRKSRGFTLIELLVVMAIIAVLSGVSLFAMENSRKSARDARRKADLESVRSALELYRSDCNQYPAALTFDGSTDLVGDGTNCPSTNVYLKDTPKDALNSSDTRNYYYDRTSTTEYILCAALETDTTIDTNCGSSGDLHCGIDCTYGVSEP